MSEANTKETGWTEAGIREQERALSPEQLLRWLLMFRGGEWYAETRRRLERLEKAEAQSKYLRLCLESSRNRIDDDTETINRQCTELGHLRERLEKCEAVAEYAQHYANCHFLDSGIGRTMPCTCGLDAARAALEGK